MLHGKWSKEKSVCQVEDRGKRTGSQGEGNDRDEGEGEIALHSTQAVAQILDGGIQPYQQVGIA